MNRRHTSRAICRERILGGIEVCPIIKIAAFKENADEWLLGHVA
jgi:hypothetical protein